MAEAQRSAEPGTLDDLRHEPDRVERLGVGFEQWKPDRPARRVGGHEPGEHCGRQSARHARLVGSTTDAAAHRSATVLIANAIPSARLSARCDGTSPA